VRDQKLSHIPYLSRSNLEWLRLLTDSASVATAAIATANATARACSSLSSSPKQSQPVTDSTTTATVTTTATLTDIEELQQIVLSLSSGSLSSSLSSSLSAPSKMERGVVVSKENKHRLEQLLHVQEGTKEREGKSDTYLRSPIVESILSHTVQVPLSIALCVCVAACV